MACRDRRSLRLPDEVEGARQEHRDGAGCGHGGDACLVGILDVIGGERPEPRREGRSVEVRELIGVEPQREAEMGRGLEDPRRLLGREGDPLAERIDRVG